jgi:WD40 repeat protein
MRRPQSRLVRTARIPAPFLAPALVVAALGAMLAGADHPTTEQPADPPAPPALGPSSQMVEKTDQFGDPLPDGVIARLGTTRSRAGIDSFGFLADGTVVTVGPNLDVRTWSPKSDQSAAPILLPLKGPHAHLYPQVSPDGRFVAAGTKAKVAVWERPAPAVKQVVTFELYDAQKLAFSPDGSQLAVAYQGGIALCNVRNGTLQKLEPKGRMDTTLCFSGDGQRLLAGSHEGGVVWDAQTGKVLADHDFKNLGEIPSSLDHTGSVIAVLSYKIRNNRIHFLDAITGKPVEGWTGPEVNFHHFVTFGPDGKTILIGSPDGVTWWDQIKGNPIRHFDAASSTAMGFVHPQARFSPDGKVLVSHTEQMLFRWDAATGKSLFPLSQETGHTEGLRAMGVSPDGSRVATAGWEVGVRIWEAKTGKQLARFPSSVMNQKNLDFSPNGKLLFTPSRNCDAVVKWDLATGKEVSRYNPGATERAGGDLQAFRLTPDGRSIQAATSQIGERGRGSARIMTWDVESGRVLSEKPVVGLDLIPGVGVVGFSPDALWGMGYGSLFPVAVGPQTNMLASAKVRSTGMLQEFSWDSRLVAVTAIAPSREDPSARAVVLEVATGSKVFETTVRWVTHFAFHPNGRSLAGAVPDGLVFWDLTTGKEYARRKAHYVNLNEPQPFASVVRYFPDGKKLVTGHIDTTALVWESPVRPEAARVLEQKGRAVAWEDLLSRDGSKGWAAVWALADDHGAVEFLREKAKSVAAMPAKEFSRLLADLGSDDFATREAATEELGKAVECAVGQLLASSNTELSPEQKLRVDQLLGLWKVADQRPLTPERLRMVRAVAVLELMGTPDARKLLAELAAGAAAATTTREAKRALERALR